MARSSSLGWHGLLSGAGDEGESGALAGLMLVGSHPTGCRSTYYRLSGLRCYECSMRLEEVGACRAHEFSERIFIGVVW